MRASNLRFRPIHSSHSYMQCPSLRDRERHHHHYVQCSEFGTSRKAAGAARRLLRMLKPTEMIFEGFKSGKGLANRDNLVPTQRAESPAHLTNASPARRCGGACGRPRSTVVTFVLKKLPDSISSPNDLIRPSKSARAPSSGQDSVACRSLFTIFPENGTD